MTDTASRETRNFKSSGGHTVDFYAELTGGEFNEIQRCYLKSTQAEVEPGQRQQIGGVKFSLETQIEAEYKMLEFLVFSLDGSKENVLARLKDLGRSQYAEILDFINAAQSKKKPAEAEA